MEVATNLWVGLVLSVLVTYFVMPVWGFEPSPQDAIEVTAMFTVVSVIRNYIIRRIFTRIR